MEIIIDDREGQVIPYFKNYTKFKSEFKEISFKVDRMTIGDYCITRGKKILMIIERKTWKDLSSSIRDGRSDNHNKLLELREKTGCIILYLIEGKARHSAKTKFARIPFKNLQAKLDHLMFRDNISIIYSKSCEDTVERLYQLCSNYLTLDPAIIQQLEAKIKTEEPIEGGDTKESDDSSGGELHLLKTKFVKSDMEVVYSIWRCFPNITDKTATILIENDITFNDILLGKISKDTLYSLKYPNGSIIGKRAVKILNITNLEDICNRKYYIKMLTCINGITKNTATIIFNLVKFRDLLDGKIELDTLAELKKTEKTKLGKKVAMQLLKLFC